MFLQLAFGFVVKIPLIWLDQFDTEVRNTQGWCITGRKTVFESK
jgi:hypothetical protein